MLLGYKYSLKYTIMMLFAVTMYRCAYLPATKLVTWAWNNDEKEIVLGPLFRLLPVIDGISDRVDRISRIH